MGWEVTRMRVPPLLVATIAGAGMWGLDWAFAAGEVWVPRRGPVALATAGVGLAIGVSGVRLFRRAGTTVNPIRPEGASTLVASGIYRWTRNPMYLGVATVLAAWGLWLSNWVALLAGPAVFVAWMNGLQIPAEEEALERVFGAEYAAYKRKVRRWL